MRNRNIPIRIWLDKNEECIMKTKATKVGLSNSAYLRFLITGHVPKAQPNEDFFALYRELNAIGNSLNQIAAKANAVGFINAAEYNSTANSLIICGSCASVFM